MAKTKNSLTELNEATLEETTGAVVTESTAPELPSNQDEIVDINIGMSKKRPFRINGDPNKIIRLNVADMGVGMRLQTAYENLMRMMEEIASLGSKEKLSDDEQKLTLKKMEELNEQMKEQVDYIFNEPVADKCCDGGTMWDPYDGMFRFEHIIDALLGLYENNFTHEFEKMRKKVNTRITEYKKTASHYHK